VVAGQASVVPVSGSQWIADVIAGARLEIFGAADEVSYSYALAVAADGEATFAVDPLGQGNSSRLSSGLITAQTDAFVDHQVVNALRDGKVGGVRFPSVIAVGHSLNSLIVWDEAIAYQDVDGIITQRRRAGSPS
jgi:hypothetical protein